MIGNLQGPWNLHFQESIWITCRYRKANSPKTSVLSLCAAVMKGSLTSLNLTTILLLLHIFILKLVGFFMKLQYMWNAVSGMTPGTYLSGEAEWRKDKHIDTKHTWNSGLIYRKTTTLWKQHLYYYTWIRETRLLHTVEWGERVIPYSKWGGRFS